MSINVKHLAWSQEQRDTLSFLRRSFYPGTVYVPTSTRADSPDRRVPLPVIVPTGSGFELRHITSSGNLITPVVSQ